MSDSPSILALPSTSENISVLKEGAVGSLIFDKPVRMNAVSTDMWLAVSESLARFENDADIRTVVLSGAGGKAFMSGADTTQFDDPQTAAEHEHAYSLAAERAFRALDEFTKPLIARIQGLCVGPGLAVATACDLRYAGEGSNFGIPTARIGLAYPPTAVWRLLSLIGPANAKELFFTAREYTAPEAFQLGMVNRVYPSGDLTIHVRDIAKTVARNAPLAIQAAKSSIDAVMPRPDETVLRQLMEIVARCKTSEDYEEGRRAFAVKRKPRFQGT